MGVKKASRTPPWMLATHERHRDPARGTGGPLGPDRWASASAEATKAMLMEEVPFGASASSSGPVAEARAAGNPMADLLEAQQALTHHARQVLAGKPAGLDPFSHTEMARGRPVQAWHV